MLETLDADLLADHACWFGGGTAIVLAHGEYRESVDIDLMTSDLAGYRALRQRVRDAGLSGLTTSPITTVRPATADNYGIRAMVDVDATQIKLELIHEGRVTFDQPGPDDTICGIRTLAPVDQVATKLLANDDRWADTATNARDLIDLAMMRPEPAVIEQGLAKALDAYGPTVRDSLIKATEGLRDRPQRLDDHMARLKMDQPRAVVWREIRRVADIADPAWRRSQA